MKLDAKNVSVSIAGKPIVRNLSIEVPDLKFSALLGANGSGKTSLLRILSGDLEPATCTVVHYGNGL